MNLLQTLTLGTHRLPPTQEVTDYLTLRDAVDPTADDAEKTLAAYALTERLERLRITKTDIPVPTEVDEDPYTLATGKLGRALQLLFDETYQAVLPEAIRVMDGNEQRFPHHLLPKLLDYTHGIQDGNATLKQMAIRVGGHRAEWLAKQHPEWVSLTKAFDFPVEWAKAATPASKKIILQRWRMVDAAAAFEALRVWWPGQSPKNQETMVGALKINLSATDLPWLRASLEPKRKGVRRAILQLLLHGDEARATEDLFTLAAGSLTDKGSLANIVQDPALKDVLQQYGGLKAKESIGDFLLSNLPPTTLPDLLGLAPEEYWPGLGKRELKLAATAMIAYGEVATNAAFIDYALIARREKLPLAQLSEMMAGLPQPTFEEVYHGFMDRERDGFRSGSVALPLATARQEPWSERISKAAIRVLVEKVRASQGFNYGTSREQGELWKRAIPLLHVDTFDFLRQHLHSMTERPDAFGKLALSMLQTTAFRRVLYGR